jgi:polyisoprenoid-binding protein YceI
MALAAGTYAIGSDTGSLQVRTKREGMASAVGHDLLIAFQRWSGQITVRSKLLASTHVDVTVEVGSFEILEGTGGVAVLSADDISDITETALNLLDVVGHPRATFVSSEVTASGEGGTVEGTLTIRGQSAPVTIDVVETDDQSWRGTATLLQTAFGIKPYRAFFGALRLADPVLVEVTVDLSGT